MREHDEDPHMMPDIRWHGGLMHDAGRCLFVLGFVGMWIAVIIAGGEVVVAVGDYLQKLGVF